MKLSEAQRRTLFKLPDTGVSLALHHKQQTLLALRKRGLARVALIDQSGHSPFHGWQRTPAGRAALEAE